MTGTRFDRIATLSAGRRLSRRTVMTGASAGLAASAAVRFGARPATAAARQSTPITGLDVPELVAFDDAFTAMMAKWGAPGGQLAVAREGRLVLNHGYGLANLEDGEAVQPDALFRMGSVAKAVTAIAIMMLVDAGKLTLDTNVFPLLDLEPPRGATIDPRFNDITVEQLLVHSGGWDRDTTGVDPTLLPWSRMAAANVGVDDPPEAVSVVRFMLGMGLDFDPGSKSVYSNFGFSVLGRVIEQASGQPYGEYVRDHMLAPIGITTMQLGRTREIDRAPGEVHYYAQPDLPQLNSVFWGDGFVPAAYGSFYLEGTDAHGGWIMSAADMVRLTLAVDGQRGAALLSPAALESMLATPRPQESGIGSGWNKKPVPGGLGWDVTPVDGGFEWSKGGALTGTCGALPFRRADGLTFTFVVNTLPDDFRTFVFETAQAILAAADSVSAWPEHDLFAESEPAATPGA